jgi:hypothetical protein
MWVHLINQEDSKIKLVVKELSLRDNVAKKKILPQIIYYPKLKDY